MTMAPFPQVTRIEADRVVIRPVTTDDLPGLLEVNGDPAVTHFVPYPTWTGLDDGIAWLERMERLVAGGTAQQLVIEHRALRRAIGGVLLFKHEPGSARLEIGYVLGQAHWHQGLAGEALRAVCGWLFTSGGIRRIEAEVNPDNRASCALLERLGFVREGRLRQRWVAKGRSYDVDMYGCLAGDWPAPD